VDAQRFRKLANRCRELARVAEKDKREQLRQWTIEFEAEAKAAEKAEQLHRPSRRMQPSLF
jgi:phage anti-repressor protein